MESLKIVETSVRFSISQKNEQRIDRLQAMAKILLKQRLDFPLEKRIKTTDSIPPIEDHKNIETTVRFSFEKQFKRRKIASNQKSKSC